ncbi:unnamed protein product [Acanthoscelides obtectus]|uniref:O-acyltransferase WSD1 C-terminal domain-containing protein n=2 Tax=Acanthoscelides obtectus TaxID=200917 RepID=A0A9P0NPZ8_ACAOB|nr:unnamed protein product [Acanthoscelides obtectus]CAK1639793.1 hypothetical protein AOBTE_LOCUS11379 [Acanthoscelides obtectus]
MLDFLVTLFLFNVTLFLIPVIFLGFVVLKFCHWVWLTCISFIHTDVEFVKYVTVRSLLDTHRNQGIITVLLCVKGQAQPEAVRKHLQEVVRRRDKFGNLAFPRLRHCLVTRCGTYAWQRGKFDLDQNLTVAPFTFKGRAVTEFNIQEYVSDIVSKYLPASIPPWQVIIIPSSEDNHYILLKLHHMLLSEGLNIGDLLPLIPPTRPNSGTQPSKSPLVEVFRKPVVIPALKEKATEELSNRWNEFVASYDPLERPELLKNTPTFFEFLCISLITLVSLVKDCRKGFRVIKNDAYSKIKYTFFAALRETEKRQVNVKTFLLSILKSLDPRNVIVLIFRYFYFFCIYLPIRIPIIIYAEIKAFFTCLTLGYCPYPYTFVGIMYTYVPLIYNSTKEIFYILLILVSAPKTILQDILLQKESLQTITLCGRKSVAWSDPVKIETIKTISKQTAVSETEVMLSAISMCLAKYFTQSNQNIPCDLPVTMRNVCSNYIFATGPNIKPEDHVSGILCLNLPIPDPEKDVSLLENLLEIKNKFNSALEKQGLSHLLTMLQTKFGILTMFLPSTILSVYLKYLSRKYAVVVTEVTSRYPNVFQKTLWGQEVTSVIYWRPPQANTSEYTAGSKISVQNIKKIV